MSLETECTQSPDGVHETGRVEHKCFGLGQGMTTWCRHCEKKMPAYWIDPRNMEMIRQTTQEQEESDVK